MASGVVDPARIETIVAALLEKKFAHVPEPGALEISEDKEIGRDRKSVV